MGKKRDTLHWYECKNGHVTYQRYKQRGTRCQMGCTESARYVGSGHDIEAARRSKR